MRLPLVLGGCLAACGGSTATRARPQLAPVTDVPPGNVADDRYKPSYGKPELDAALAAEREKLAALEQQIAALEATPVADDQLRVALGDLAVRRRFVATVEACAAGGVDCPPRLDEPAWTWDPETTVEPPLDAVIRFDVDDWQKIAAELHGRACACRTRACVDTVEIAIARLENQPMREVRDDDAASTSIVRARECLARLRGGKRIERVQSD